jgi:hypothetical protein
MSRQLLEPSMLTRHLQRQRGTAARDAVVRLALPLLRIVALAILAIVLVTIIFPALVAAQAAAF